MKLLLHLFVASAMSLLDMFGSPENNKIINI